MNKEVIIKYLKRTGTFNLRQVSREIYTWLQENRPSLATKYKNQYISKSYLNLLHDLEHE